MVMMDHYNTRMPRNVQNKGAELRPIVFFLLSVHLTSYKFTLDKGTNYLENTREHFNKKENVHQLHIFKYQT